MVGRVGVGRDPRCTTGSSVTFQAAVSANRANAGTDFDPVFFMIEARWFSTVRWLIPKIRGDVLAGVSGEHQLHDLALTRREPRDVIRRILSPGGQLARIPRLLERALDAGEQFIAADRLLDEIQTRPPSWPEPPSARRCCR